MKWKFGNMVIWTKYLSNALTDFLNFWNQETKKLWNEETEKPRIFETKKPRNQETFLFSSSNRGRPTTPLPTSPPPHPGSPPTPARGTPRLSVVWKSIYAGCNHNREWSPASWCWVWSICGHLCKCVIFADNYLTQSNSKHRINYIWWFPGSMRWLCGHSLIESSGSINEANCRF